MASIELRGASRRYGSDARALDAVDLAITSGERLAVLGPSGSGKTTILRLIAGFDRPTSGEVWISGALADGVPPHRRDVGMVFQEPTLHPHLDVAGNLEFGMKARGVAREERRRRVGEVASMLRLDEVLGRRPAQLSGGERQRAAIGRAVARRPAVLLLDEPFSSLDLPLRASLRRDLASLHDRYRMTLVHVTHDQGEALALGHRVAVLDGGRLVQVGPPRQVYEKPASTFVASFVGDPPMNLIPCEILLDSAAGEYRLFLGSGGAATVPEAFARDLGLEPDRRRAAILGLRPEHIRPSLKGAGEEPSPGFATSVAEVRRVEYRGDAAVVSLEMGGVSVVALDTGTPGAREGARVFLMLDLSRACWFIA